MKYIKYSRYAPDAADDLDLQELMNRLSDFFLQSGFESPYGIYEMDMERSQEQLMEQLRQAILRALQEGDLIPQELMDKLTENPDLSQNQELRDLIDQIIERMEQEGYITQQQSARITPPPSETPGGQIGRDQPKVEARFEITDKALDFLGFKTLKDLLASLGKSSFGRHDTRDLATGVESGGTSKNYEFGDTLNMDISGTLFNAVQRNGLGLPIDLDYPDLMVHQCEYQSSCATVLLLDCSHSMILYGEDRFTPAKRVALALSHLIRTQYPGDSLHCVLFHDSAEEIPLGKLARVQVGPYYTNTREGLRVAQRILARQKKDMRQIIMITDGKPSALTLEDGRIYKNAFGLDPLVVLINTFMLASDYSLVHFVQKITELCRGKAYFTTPYTLGQYLLMDYVGRKTRNIH
jgi:Ca-activated chloride channel homolog